MAAKPESNRALPFTMCGAEPTGEMRTTSNQPALSPQAPTWRRQLVNLIRGVKRHGLFSKDIKSLDDLFVHQLQDIYYAEHQITRLCPR